MYRMHTEVAARYMRVVVRSPEARTTSLVPAPTRPSRGAVLRFVQIAEPALVVSIAWHARLVACWDPKHARHHAVRRRPDNIGWSARRHFVSLLAFDTLQRRTERQSWLDTVQSVVDVQV